jgi:hypothetical protein
MSYKLQFPYSEEERINFIVEHNHNSGRAIYTVDNYVEIEYDVIDTVEKEDGETVEEVVGKEIKLENRPTYYALEKNEIWDEENEQPIIDPEYEEKQKAKEKARIAELSLTRADVFEGLILARGLSKQDLRAFIENDETLSPVEKALYLNRFDDALEFYRKHPAIDFISEKLGISSENMDKFFDTKDYTYLKGEN